MNNGHTVLSNGSPISRLALPRYGAANPGREKTATTPGSFALAPDIGGPRMFASPDTPGMPAVSERTAWDFLPDGWRRGTGHQALGTGEERAVFTTARGA